MIVTGEVYHVFNKSISEFKIFNSESDFLRIKNVIRYYQIEKQPVKFSEFEERKVKNYTFNNKKLVEIICYCLMPTHIHLVVKQLIDLGISKFMNNILNSYSRYFNIKHNRKGPLWEGRFKKVLVETDEQLLHLTRYIHLNPTTAYLVDKPIDWEYSSYKEYISDCNERICKYEDIIDIKPDAYKTFVEDRISYQRELAKIRGLILE